MTWPYQLKIRHFFLPQIFQECKYYCFIISTTIVIDDFWHIQRKDYGDHQPALAVPAIYLEAVGAILA